jgi:NAD(P)-dependent dehydrogenase (short-subunit alcohol dehydrogenase family)
MDLQLRGRKAIVTGATKCIGLSIARMLAGEGVDVAICARTAADVRTTVQELAGKGVKACGDAVDVQDREVYTRWIGSAPAGASADWIFSCPTPPARPGLRVSRAGRRHSRSM